MLKKKVTHIKSPTHLVVQRPGSCDGRLRGVRMGGCEGRRDGRIVAKNIIIEIAGGTN